MGITTLVTTPHGVRDRILNIITGVIDIIIRFPFSIFEYDLKAIALSILNRVRASNRSRFFRSPVSRGYRCVLNEPKAFLGLSDLHTDSVVLQKGFE